MSGVASATSKSMNPPLIFWARSSPPTMSAPAAVAFSALSPWAKTATRTVLPMPCGKRDRAADVLVALARVDPEVRRDLDRLVELRGAERLQLRMASARGTGSSDRPSRSARDIVSSGSPNCASFRGGCRRWFLPRVGAAGHVTRRAVAPGTSGVWALIVRNSGPGES